MERWNNILRQIMRRERKEERKIKKKDKNMWKCPSLLVILNDSNLCIKWAEKDGWLAHGFCSATKYLSMTDVAELNWIEFQAFRKFAQLLIVGMQAYLCWNVMHIVMPVIVHVAERLELWWNIFFFFSCQIGLHLTSIEVFLPNLCQEQYWNAQKTICNLDNSSKFHLLLFN
jgi:hypothetical protein